MIASTTPNRRHLPVRLVLGSRVRSSLATVIAIVVVGIAILVAAWINMRAADVSRLSARSIEIRERAERFLGHIRDAETGQRGYLLTGLPVHLEPYTGGRAAALPELDALERLVEDEPLQKERVAKARAITRDKFAELERTIAMMKAGAADEARVGMRDGRSIGLMDELRAQVRDIQRQENDTLTTLAVNEERRRVLATVGIVVALAALAFAAWQQLRTRQRRTAMLSVSNARLEELVGQRTQQLENERLRIEALLQDVSHRVGNNLAMVSALLNVQSRRTDEPAVKLALAQAQSRIQAIAAGQRRLRLDIDTDEIDARPYMEDLLAEIGKAVGDRPIAIELDMGEIRLPGRDAVSFVVIVNELVTNAIKHAFPNGLAGRIVIRFRETSDDPVKPSIVLEIEDDGIGMPPVTQTSTGLGQTVITSLLRSMRATMETEACRKGAAREGTRIVLRFPKTSPA